MISKTNEGVIRVKSWLIKNLILCLVSLFVALCWTGVSVLILPSAIKHVFVTANALSFVILIYCLGRFRVRK